MKVWFITGASKGLGLALVKQLLKNGNQVAATSRNIADLTAAVASNDNFLPLQVDLINEDSVGKAIAQTVQAFGKLDVVVNNAGYGLLGATEEISDKEVRQQLDVNVFAVLNVIRKALPYLREQQSGHIFNISSVAGYVGYGGASSYNAAKFAVTGLTAALVQELAPLGIKVTDVAPGYFRTNFLNSGSLLYSENKIAAYDHIHQIKEYNDAADGKQQGDPEKAARAFIQAAENPHPPAHLVLGSDAYQTISARLKAIQQELDELKAISFSTDFE
jgi:NAD(P)-dependent dehydrogenase (short-subunit alcohol dehydrogenase family)